MLLLIYLNSKPYLMKQAIISLFLLLFLFSCNTPKYTYFFDTGKYLDFGSGKWILNRSKSNSKIFDAELYDASRNQFRQILGDSLFEINDIRVNKLLPPKINFNLSKKELLELNDLTECDYLINIKGNIIGDGAGTISILNDPNHYATNQSSVSILIYDLNTGILISSSQVNAKVVDQGSQIDNSSIPKISTSSHTAMVQAAKNLIKKYSKYNKKSGGP